MDDASADYRELDLIERFIRGELEGDELKNFLTRLSAEPGLKERVLLYESMFRGINASRRNELKEYISANAVIPPLKQGSGMTWLMVGSVAASLIVGAVIFYQVKKDKGVFAPNNELAVKTPTVTKDESTAAEESNIPPAADIAGRQDSITTKFTEPAIVMDTRTQVSEGQAVPADDLQEQKPAATSEAMSKEEFYSVKGDEFMGDTVVMLQEKSAADVKNIKYNKESDRHTDTVLSENSDRESSVSFQVEFWRSPINYRGYRFNPKKLLLFGLADSTLQGIYQLEGEYYLKADERYYRLKQDDRFNSYMLLTDKNILNKLKN